VACPAIGALGEWRADLQLLAHPGARRRLGVRARPGLSVDVLVTADLAAFHRVWLGRISFADALRDESVRLDGPRRLTRAFESWFAWSPFAPAVRAARQREQLRA
jgi:hypothetical protein